MEKRRERSHVGQSERSNLADIATLVQSAFVKTDASEDGLIIRMELSHLFEMIGGLSAQQTDRLVKTFRRADRNRDGTGRY